MSYSGFSLFLRPRRIPRARYLLVSACFWVAPAGMQAAVAADAAQRIYIDPVTGTLRAPTLEERQSPAVAAEVPAVPVPDVEVKIIDLQGGGQKIPVGDRFVLEHRVRNKDYAISDHQQNQTND